MCLCGREREEKEREKERDIKDKSEKKDVNVVTDLLYSDLLLFLCSVIILGSD